MINHHFHAKEVDEKQLGKSRNGYVCMSDGVRRIGVLDGICRAIW